MTNNPQSSRRTALQSVLPKINVNKAKTINSFKNVDDYTVTGTPTSNGDMNVKFSKKQQARSEDYILLLVALGVGFFLIHKQIEKIP